MPSKPLGNLLDRELSKALAKDIIGVASPLLQELVNYSTNAFARCTTSSSPLLDDYEDLPIPMLYLHVIEMTDGIEALVSQSCTVPAVPLIRSSFEALLSIEYILESDYTQRSLSWFTVYIHEELERYDLLDTSTSKGESFQKDISLDKVLRMVQDFKFPPVEEVQKYKADLRGLLGEPQFLPIEAEIKEYRKKHRRKPHWYQLFGGPANLRELARHVNRHAHYDLLYREWSSITHAHDIRLKGSGSVSLRDPSKINQVSLFAATFILVATHSVLMKFCPGESESLTQWYLKDVRERYHTFSN